MTKNYSANWANWKIEIAKAESDIIGKPTSDQNFWVRLVDPTFGKRSFCASGLKGSLRKFSLPIKVKEKTRWVL